MTRIKNISDFINENNASRRITSDDGVFHSADEILDDWRKHGYNSQLDIEEMCISFDADYEDFREDVMERMTGEDLVLMMTKIHYPPIKEFEPSDFIKKLCDTSKTYREGEGDVEDTFGVDPYQEYTFGGNYEGTVQLNDELQYCVYGYSPINDIDKLQKGVSPVVDYIIDNVKKTVYYADKFGAHSYEYRDDDLYIYEYYNVRNINWITRNIKMYAANLTCEGDDSNTYLILCCEND